MFRPSIAVPGESMATYALVKVVPSAGSFPNAPVHVALVLDVSGSTDEEDGTARTRLDRARAAVLATLPVLRPGDRVSLVGYANGHRLLLGSTPVYEEARIRAALQQVDLANDGRAAATTGEGIRLALQETTSAGTGRSAFVVVLTEGATTAAAECRELARSAVRAGVRFSLIGLGSAWDLALLPELARITGGRWHYVDADHPPALHLALAEEFDRLASIGFVRVSMRLRTVRDVRVKRVRRVAPEIEDLPHSAMADRLVTVPLGSLEHGRTTSYLVDLSLPKRPDGRYVVAQVEVIYEPAGGRAETTGPQPLEMVYDSAGGGYVNAEVARHIDEVQIYELATALAQALAADNRAEVRRLAEQLARKGDMLGPRGERKAALARRMLDELDAGGTVQRGTRAALEDAARRSAEHCTSGPEVKSLT